MRAGSRAFTPRTQAFSGREAVVSKWTTCESACTPASVRPAQTVATGCPASAQSEASSGEFLYGARLPYTVKTQAELGELLQEQSTAFAPATSGLYGPA